MSNIIDLKAHIQAKRANQDKETFSMFPEPTSEQFQAFVNVIRYLHQFYDVTEIDVFDYEMMIKVREYTDYYGDEEDSVRGGRIVEFAAEVDISREISDDVCASNIAEAFDQLIDEYEDYEQSTDE